MDKGPSSQSYSFSSNHVWMWELDHKEGWVLKNWCFWTVMLEKTLESPLDWKEITPVNPNGNQPWILVGKTDAEAEAPVFWSSDVNSWLIRKVRKVPDAGKDCGQKKRVSEDDMAGWHYQCNGHELGQTSGRWWETGRPGMLQFKGLQRVEHDLFGWVISINCVLFSSN